MGVFKKQDQWWIDSRCLASKKRVPGTTAGLSRILPPRIRTITQTAISGLVWRILTGGKIRLDGGDGNRPATAGVGLCKADSGQPPC